MVAGVGVGVVVQVVIVPTLLLAYQVAHTLSQWAVVALEAQAATL